MGAVSDLLRRSAASAFTSKAAANEFCSLLDYPQFNGTTFYVSSVVGSDTYTGRTPGQPFATIAVAMAACTANKGDRIYILSGHAETYSTTGSKLTTKAGVQIIGVGTGADRPTFTFSHTGATWTMSAAGVHLVNTLLVTGVDSVTAFATISGADNTLIDVETRDTTDVEVIDAFITTATADRLKVIGHLHNGYTGGNANLRVWKLVGCDRPLFQDCRWITKAGTAVINFVSTACTGVVINNCAFLVDSTTNFSKNVVDTVTGSTWGVTGNSFDIGAGQFFGGGSGAALAGVSVSAITDALYGANGVVSYPASAAPANGVSIAEVLGWINDALQGTAGVVTFPAAAAPANAVSLAEVIRSIYNKSSYDSAASVVTTNPLLGNMVSKTEDVNAATGVDLFTVTGKVLITAMFGEVTNAIGAGVTDYILRIKTDNVNLCASTDIGSAAVGVLYSLSGQSTDTLESNAEGVKTVDVGGKGLANRLVGLAGGSCTIQSVRTAGDASDAIIWTVWYVPLEASASIVAV